MVLFHVAFEAFWLWTVMEFTTLISKSIRLVSERLIGFLATDKQ